MVKPTVINLFHQDHVIKLILMTGQFKLDHVIITISMTGLFEQGHAS